MPLRTPHTTIFFDLDDTLYHPSCGIWDLIGDRMDQYIHDRLNLEWESIPTLRRSLYEAYGTTMRGLQMSYAIDPEDFLAFVHDVPVEERLQPDPFLRKILLALPLRRLVLTNADERHAKRVLLRLGIEDCFEGIIDIHQVAPACKPLPEAFQKALMVAGEDQAARCIFIDDSPRNLLTARELGFFTILVGSNLPHPSAHRSILHLADLPAVLSELNLGRQWQLTL